MKINISNDDFKDMGLSVSQKDFYNSFVEMGFPNRKKEDWKFTDLDNILNSNFDQLTPIKKKGKNQRKTPLLYKNLPKICQLI